MAKTLVYQLYPRAWQSLKEMTEHLERIAKLEVDYVWLSPLYPSPGFDHGYDVADYKAIDQRFGTMQDFDNFVEVAHSFGIGVLMDLVLNHTSTAHTWFKKNPDYYCWSDTDRPAWHNLFDDGSAWEKYCDNYYLHLFHKYQADLNWFHDDFINESLVSEFQDIVRFWLEEHGVDGFRLDFIQGLNKDLSDDSLDITTLLYENGAECVIDSIFGPSITTRAGDSPFLIAELFDPTPEIILQQYAKMIPQINFFLNPLIKGAITDDHGYDVLCDCLEVSAENPKFMLDLESHDAPRFTSISGLPARQIINLMFDSGAEGVCLYQGQELGTTNPVWVQMTDKAMLELDAVTAMRFQNGEDIRDLRKFSRANARVRISLTGYVCQEGLKDSVLEFTKAKIKAWKAEA